MPFRTNAVNYTSRYGSEFEPYSTNTLTIIFFTIHLNLNTNFVSATFTGDLMVSHFLPNVNSVYKRPFPGLSNKPPLTAQPVNTFYDNS